VSANAFVDTETGDLVSDVEDADIGYIAFTSRPAAQHTRDSSSSGQRSTSHRKTINPIARWIRVQ
jgi:hypothetical protein